MNDHHSNSFGSGFMMGLLVGAGLVFLFGTNKGKKILQSLLDQVEENTAISDLLEMPEEDDEYIGIEADEEPEDEEKHEKIAAEKSETVAKVKRFFKHSKKMVS